MAPGWLKPEYLYRPRQGLRRLLRVFDRVSSGEFVVADLPWGMPLRVRPGEVHGAALLDLGVIDLAVTEVLWRLTDPGETAADVGANIGAMSAVLAARVGKGGCVFAFEAHPAIFEELAWNVALWKDVTVRPENVALSRESGSVSLSVPADFQRNRGLAKVGAAGEPGSVQVPAKRFDDCFAEKPPSVM